jgi:hypothetical protein
MMNDQCSDHGVLIMYVSCDNKKVPSFVSCDLWNDNKHALIMSKAIAMAMVLQKAWGIRNAYILDECKHGATVVGVVVGSW